MKDHSTTLRVYRDGVIDQTRGVSHSVGDGDTLRVGNLSIRVIQTPCHTRGSLWYLVTTEGHPGVLFGIGAFFEGDSAAMVSIFRRLVELIPPETVVYYAINFLSLDPTNEALAHRLDSALRFQQNFLSMERTHFRPRMESLIFPPGSKWIKLIRESSFRAQLVIGSGGDFRAGLSC
jgi:glyoxylase-like metal-dependent hydrolase (beta-lactamase superfamily II)